MAGFFLCCGEQRFVTLSGDGGACSLALEGHLTFKSDEGGPAFACHDAKLSIGASTWNTRLSQLARMPVPLYILTAQFDKPHYISEIFSKRPRDIWVVAHISASREAEILKSRFPAVQIALHPEINAKLVAIGPETVWVTSADFGDSELIEAGVGLYSVAVYEHAVNAVFRRVGESAGTRVQLEPYLTAET